MISYENKLTAKAQSKAISLGVFAPWRELSWLLVSQDMWPVLVSIGTHHRQA